MQLRKHTTEEKEYSDSKKSEFESINGISKLSASLRVGVTFDDLSWEEEGGQTDVGIVEKVSGDSEKCRGGEEGAL